MGRVSKRICCIKDCNNTVHGAGMCGKHYQRLKNNGDPTKAERRVSGQDCVMWLRDNVSYDGPGCLTWFHSRGRHGYGDNFAVGGGAKETPHRYMCFLANGPPPSPAHVAAHSCNRGKYGCVDARHLRWATHVENAEDRRLHGTMPVGEGHVNAKLTEVEVREIRSLRGKMTQRAIAEKFGISVGHTCQLQRGGRWGREEHSPSPEYLQSKMCKGRKVGIIR